MNLKLRNLFSVLPKHKILLGSFIFLSLYTGALYTFATTYVSPGTILDPLGIPGSYTVTPPLTYGGTVTSGHDTEILYIDSSGELASDSLFVRESSTGNFLVAQGFGLDEFASFQLNDSKQSAQMAYNNTSTGERAQVSAGGGPIQVDASYEDGVSIFGEFTLASGGNTLLWDADTTDDITDYIVQAQNISGAGIDGTLIGHSDSNTQDHAISAWGDFTGQGGQAFQAITSVGSGNIEVGHSISPANGYQINYYDGGINKATNLTLDGNANIFTFDADITDTITYGLEQSENILELGLVSGSFNYYEDTNTDLVTVSGSGDFTPAGGNPATSIILTKSTATDDIAGFQTSYDPGFPEMNAVGQVVNGTNQASLILNSTDSDLIFSPDSGTSMSGMTANSIASYLFRNDGTTNWAAGISDGLFEVKDLTNSNDYLKIDMTNGLYQLGDIDGVGNSTLLNVDDVNKTIVLQVDLNLDIQNEIGKKYFVFDDDQDKITIGDIDTAGNSTLFTVDDINKTITGTSLISGTKNTSMKVGSIPGLSLPGSAFDYSDSVAGQSSSIGVGDFSGLGGNSNTGYMTWYTGATLAQSLLTTNSAGIIGLFTDGTGATYNNEFHLGASGFTLSSNSGSYTFPIGDGTTDYVLATDGAGQLFWQDPTLIPSDQTLKSNIAPSTYGLSTILQLNPVSYTLNVNNKQQIGFIAQEVEPLIPELIGEIAGGKKGLAYGQLSAVIVKSIQELDLKIKPLEDLITENNAFAEVLRVWLANASNNITRIFTGEICLTEVGYESECITRGQLHDLKQLINSGGTGTSGGTSGTGDGTTGNSSSGDGTDSTGGAPITGGDTTGGDSSAGGTTSGDGTGGDVSGSTTTGGETI